MNTGFRFRVTCRVWENNALHPRQVDFQYPTFAKARANYKAILLELYRAKTADHYEICLNRAKDPQWDKPIFYDSD